MLFLHRPNSRAHGSLTLGMAGLAERDEIVKVVGSAPVAVEITARVDVVHVQPWAQLLQAAVLAGVVIPFARLARLVFPIRAKAITGAADVMTALLWMAANVGVPAFRRAEAIDLNEIRATRELSHGATVLTLNMCRWLTALWDGLACFGARNRCAMLRRFGAPLQRLADDRVVALARTVVVGSAMVYKRAGVDVELHAADFARSLLTCPAANVGTCARTPATIALFHDPCANFKCRAAVFARAHLSGSTAACHARTRTEAPAIHCDLAGRSGERRTAFFADAFNHGRLGAHLKLLVWGVMPPAVQAARGPFVACIVTYGGQYGY